MIIPTGAAVCVIPLDIFFLFLFLNELAARPLTLSTHELPTTPLLLLITGMEDISTSNDQPKASVVGDGKEEGDIHTNDSSDDVRYPSPTKLAVLLFGSCLGAFLVGLDSTIITTAIPRITDDFHSTADVGWYGSAYLLLACAFQPLFGRIYTHFDVRKSYFVALGSFLLGSLICGVAPSSIAVIVGRAFAGLGCAGIIAGNLNIVALSSPLATRSIYISLLGAVYVGPILHWVSGR